MVEYSYYRRAALSKELKALSEPLFETHDEYLRERIPHYVKELREQLRHEYPDVQAIKDLIEVKRKRVNLWQWQRAEYDRNNHVPDEVNQWLQWFWDPALIYGGSLEPRLDQLIEESVRTNRMKLQAALEVKLGNLPLEAIEEIRSKVSKQGIEGDYLITLKDGTTGKFSTKSIAAGGHTIQRFHFRYLMKLDSKLVDRERVDPDTLTPEIRAVLQILSKHQHSFKPSKDAGWLSIGDEAFRAVNYRDWGPLKKKRFIRERPTGPSQWDWQISKAGLMALQAL